MKTVDRLVECATVFYKELESGKNDRFRSWEYCYDAFCDGKNKDVDYLCLHLAFYLASWGMYRGSSFLLQKDYKVHAPAVRKLLSADYACLRGISCRELKEHTGLLHALSVELEKYYMGVRADVAMKRRRNTAAPFSRTLLTKIIMGTLGCCPAYDRYFVRGLKDLKMIQSYSEKSIKELSQYYIDHEEVFRSLSTRVTTIGKNPYPQMKIVDMAFWKYGFDLPDGSGKGRR